MRLQGDDGSPITGSLWAVLTPEEAFLLKEALIIYFEEDPADPGWHHHLGRSEAEGLTIAVETASASAE